MRAVIFVESWGLPDLLCTGMSHLLGRLVRCRAGPISASTRVPAFAPRGRPLFWLFRLWFDRLAVPLEIVEVAVRPTRQNLLPHVAVRLTRGDEAGARLFSVFEVGPKPYTRDNHHKYSREGPKG